MVIKGLLLIIIGFSGGLAVGSGTVAFLSVLGIIPRLSQLTKTSNHIRQYEWSVITGSIAGTWFSLRDITFSLSPFILIPLGIAAGIFTGMVAAALTEVINVLPILAKRIGIHEKILILLMALVLGKVIGSLFHWSFFVDIKP